MSVILEALKKAQDERRKANSRPTDADEFPPSRKMGRLYLLFGLALVLLAIVFLVPDLRQALRFNARTGEMSSQTQKSSPMATITARNNASKPDAQTSAGSQQQGSSESQTATTRQVSAAKGLPKVSWAPRIEVPVGRGKQGPSSAPAAPSNPQPVLPSSLDPKFEQSIIVKTTDVKDTAAQMYNSALGQMELGRSEEARRSYLAALAHKPDDSETLNNLGVLVMNGGNTRDAFSYFKMALSSRDDYAKAHNNLGILYMKEGQNRPAEEHLRRALKLDPGGVEPYLNLSALLRSEGRFEEASRLLAGLLKNGCKQPIVYLSHGIINDEMGNYPEAITYYREYLSKALQGAERSRVTERLKVLEGLRSAGNR
ncbi:MAG TPA: hypothetical protein DCR97_10465 [Deltaproteobacteria bacterium]|nr:hypothetical protein [Deltaproteobacteria bacterium]